MSLPAGCRVRHGAGTSVRHPFPDMPLTMHEVSAGGAAFSGQFGFIPFTTAVRLPRHVHLGEPDAGGGRALLAERILVLEGTGLVELCGALTIVAPGSLLEIGPGVPHTWTACAAGLRLPDGTLTTGRFLMVYEYERPTGFFPTASTARLASAADYRRHEGDLDAIKISLLSPDAVAAQAGLVWNDAPAKATSA